MPEPILQPDISAPHTPAPSIVPAGVEVQGATPNVASVAPVESHSMESSEPSKEHFAFFKEIDWVEAVIVVGFIAGLIYAINYYSTQLKTQQGVIATLTNEISDLQNSVTELKQQQTQNTKTTNSAGRYNVVGNIEDYF